MISNLKNQFVPLVEIHLNILLRKWIAIVLKADQTRVDYCLNNIHYPHTSHRHSKYFVVHLKWKATQTRTNQIYVTRRLLVHLRLALLAIIITHVSLFVLYVRSVRTYNMVMYVTYAIIYAHI